MDFIRDHQLNIMLSLGNVCGAVAFSMLISGVRSRRRKILFFLLLSASILLISDRYIWIFEGNTEPLAWWMLRINAFLCYETTILVFLATNLYLKELFAENKDLDPCLKRFTFNNIVLIAGAALVFIFQFTDLYYYFDEANTYKEGLLYPLFTFLPFVSMMVDISLILQYFKKLKRNVRISLLIFAIIPFLNPIMQIMMPGIDSADMTFTFMAMILYSIDLVNTNRAAEASIRALAVSDAKSEFLSNMSHEIRTPLNSVLGMNEMVLRECDDPKILGYSENIRSSGNTLLGLINDILDFSKIEAGKIEIIPVDYDLSAVIHDLANMIHVRTDAKGLELKLDIDGSTPKLLNGDEVRIKQVITNILTNAAKYTEKGSITFKISCKKADRDNDRVLIRVSVADTGIGIKQEDMEKLFTKFERIEEKRNIHIEGTGLGMSITRSLLEMMGSDLKVESVYGQGSTFSFDLEQKVVAWDPIGDPEQSYRERLKDKEKYKEKLYAPDARVLVVDDNKVNLTVFKSLIKKTGIQTDTAKSGDECLEKTALVTYDIIFLDQMMPGKNGTETLHELREQASNPNLNTPVICLTANAISGAREQYISEGFTDYLTKPIPPDRLEDMLIELLPEDKYTLTTE
ncbi:MAG: response regulator [Lachnospiraceae bacterium]|nr:response regulator [Lachnospiraceae bacterium]